MKNKLLYAIGSNDVMSYSIGSNDVMSCGLCHIIVSASGLDK